ncbi:hypothetical protein MYP_4713 [Sporocytophaga myxococcoides]|uniref:Uncharacterized protein n=1 Tax=Sporocytophaga myxococcoides TaxID=153721 RepID=A0A098LMY6_9BACT|nr:hypothetical protein MYP_4713 [Sporocytophaga myxococcoides]
MRQFYSTLFSVFNNLKYEYFLKQILKNSSEDWRKIIVKVIELASLYPFSYRDIIYKK